jgi:hypothetical protein
VNYDKTLHISTKCAWLHQKKPVATFVGFGGEGLGCLVAEHTKDSTSEDKNNAVALVKVKDSQNTDVTRETIEMGLGNTYPWRWLGKQNMLLRGLF